jgi:hypothetical protein
MRILAVALILIQLAMSFAFGQGIPCHAFRRNADGSWSVVQPVTIQGPNGSSNWVRG